MIYGLILESGHDISHIRWFTRDGPVDSIIDGWYPVCTFVRTRALTK